MAMKQRTEEFCADFFNRHPDLADMRTSILDTVELLKETFAAGGKLLLCGNGGSCADCDHIAGELLKGFLLRRPTGSDFRDAMEGEFGEAGADIAKKLQCGLPAISLVTHSAALSAFANDVDPALMYAQQVLAYGKPGDVLLGISTSGNAENVTAAMMTARALGMPTIALTGRDGGKMGKLAHIALIAPQQETYRIQELHLAIYHLLCAAVEFELFDE